MLKHYNGTARFNNNLFIENKRNYPIFTLHLHTDKPILKGRGCSADLLEIFFSRCSHLLSWEAIILQVTPILKVTLQAIC